MDGLTYRTATQSVEDPNEYILSDETVDRMGDQIVAEGWDLKKFKQNPIALFNHSSHHIVGTWEKVRVQGKQLRGRLKLAEAGTSDTVDMVRSLYQQGILKMVSVGFKATKKEPLHKDADEFFGPFKFVKSELLECSIVAIPANPNAGPVARSVPMPADVISQIFGVPAVLPAPANAPRVPATPPQKAPTKMSSISQRIQASQVEITQFRDKLVELAKLDQPDEDQLALIDELTDTAIPKAEADLARLQRMEKAMATKPTEDDVTIIPPEPKAADRRPFAMPRRKVEPYEYIFRSLATWSAAAALREPLEKVMNERYGQDENLGAVLRAATNPALTSVAGWAAELTQTANVDFLNRLLPNSIYPALSGAGVKYTFGPNVQLKIPVRNAAAPGAVGSVAGAWVGEGAPKPVRRATFTSIPLNPYKMAVISTFSEEMALYANPAIEEIIRQAMQDDTSISLDTYLIDAVAGSSIRPAGLLNGVTPITASVLTANTDKMIADLKALVAAIVAAGGGRNIIILINPAQAMTIGLAQTTTGDFVFNSTDEAGNKFNCRFIISQTVAAGRVIAIDAADFATATGDTPRFAVSNEATLHEEDTTPLALGTTGTPNVVAAPMRSCSRPIPSPSG
jgi:HK97 family phage prohead protease